MEFTLLGAVVGGLLAFLFLRLISYKAKKVAKEEDAQLYERITREINHVVEEFNRIDIVDRYRIHLLGWELREYLKEHGPIMNDPAMPKLPHLPQAYANMLVHEQREAGKRVAEYQQLSRVDQERQLHGMSIDDV